MSPEEKKKRAFDRICDYQEKIVDVRVGMGKYEHWKTKIVNFKTHGDEDGKFEFIAECGVDDPKCFPLKDVGNIKAFVKKVNQKCFKNPCPAGMEPGPYKSSKNPHGCYHVGK